MLRRIYLYLIIAPFVTVLSMGVAKAQDPAMNNLISTYQSFYRVLHDPKSRMADFISMTTMTQAQFDKGLEEFKAVRATKTPAEKAQMSVVLGMPVDAVNSYDDIKMLGLSFIMNYYPDPASVHWLVIEPGGQWQTLVGTTPTNVYGLIFVPENGGYRLHGVTSIDIGNPSNSAEAHFNDDHPHPALSDVATRLKKYLKN